ncbi:hypothetical protein LSH36_173g05000 [Paralvinella palmiformis]|uniref:Uncharacterized protein n=1 Tax=Paralvinella palmiformis TaxID=53620 RepID=A0AAD9N5Z0_9ANNE|nr:hypothetical protein LSH36_173g05000 [Paralvinella palmiformis]
MCNNILIKRMFCKQLFSFIISHVLKPFTQQHNNNNVQNWDNDKSSSTTWCLRDIYHYLIIITKVCCNSYETFTKVTLPQGLVINITLRPVCIRNDENRDTLIKLVPPY